MKKKLFYLTLNDSFDGIYQSQVIDVIKLYQNQNVEAKLIAIISIKSYFRDKRKIEKQINLEDLKNQLVESEKTKMLNIYSRQHYENLKRIVSVKFFDE